MTTAVTVFARTVVRQQRIPFEITSSMPNKETLEALEEVERMKRNPMLGKSYTDVDMMMKELLA